MILPDVNVLIYALRPELPQHPVCHRWLMRAVTGDAAFAVSRQVSSSVVRISKAPRALRMPCTPEEAFGFFASLLDQPHCWEWITLDRDCARFPGPRWLTPSESG